MTLNLTNLEQRQKRFNVWRADMEERLAWHLFNNGRQADPQQPGKKVVEVVESEAVAGGWDVYLNDRKMFHFAGHEAHRRATRAAEGLANG